MVRSPSKALARLSLLRTALGPLLGLACVLLVFSIADATLGGGTFLTAANLHSIVIHISVVAIAALGMTLIIISGGIDLSAGTSIALCATTLAWGLREDIGFRLRHGGNFAGVSRALDEAQHQLAAAHERSDMPSIDYWKRKRDEHRTTLTRLAQLKQARTESVADATLPRAQAAQMAFEESSPSATSARHRKLLERRADRWMGRQRQLARDAKSLAGKVHRLNDPEFRPSADGQWTSGVPNDAATPALAVLLGIVTGLVAGLVNGLLISRLRIVPFIATLGTMTAYLGIGNLLAKNTLIRPVTQDQTPFWLQDLLSMLPVAQWFGLFPAGVFLAIVLAGILSFILRSTVFGRHVFAIGSNEAAARLCGINVTWTKIAVYGLAGVFFGIAGVCHFAVASNGNPNSGVGMELLVIAAVVIGGASLSGGRGTVLGTLAGAAIMQVIESGCDQIGVAEGTRLIILGVAIIGAVWIDQVRQRRLLKA